MIRFQDISLLAGPERLVFANRWLRLEFDRDTGAWLSLERVGVLGSLIVPEDRPSLDALTDGTAVLEDGPRSLASYDLEIARDRSRATLALTWDASDAVLTARYTLAPDAARLERSARFVSRGRMGRFEGFSFALPGIALGDPADCRLTIPGPFFPQTYVAPDAPYLQERARSVDYHSAPDGGFGLLTLTNPALGMTLATWMETGGETDVRPTQRPSGDRLTWAFLDRRMARLEPNMAVESDVQRLELAAGGLSRVLAAYRASVQRDLPPAPETPDWVREMTLLEIMPAYFPGGYRGLKTRLPFYQEIGVNTLYLMPHWVGEHSGYGPIDLYQVEPSFGTKADLRDLVAEAHHLGMRVLFDMVIHGFSEKSSVPEERPELFIPDEDGGLARHPIWKSVSTDWAAPAYQEEMVELVRHDLREYDHDGYRVDAASFKGPNWSPGLPEPAYRSATASPDLMGRMLAALRETKPDAVMLSEVFGPVFATVCNLLHDNQTEAVAFLQRRMDEGKATAADYQAHIANLFDALPPGANRVFFARNHDTSWFDRFDGYTPRFFAFETVHALCAIPEIFAGDPGNPPNPDDDPEIFARYKRLFAFRRAWPEWTQGRLSLREIGTGNPNVFAVLRRTATGGAFALISFRETPETVHLTLPDDLRPPQRLVDIDESADINWTEPTLTLAPFQALAGRLTQVSPASLKIGE